MKLIEDRSDIEVFVNEFYERVKYDSVIQHFFTKERGFSFEQHIPIMCDFWETILLDNPVYRNNAMEVHYDLNKKIPLQKEYFTNWLQLFNSAVDDLFEGKTAVLAKTRAKSIADVMLFKMANANKGL